MRLFDTDRWEEIWQTIARNRKRSIMTALGIFWGIFMLTVMLGAGSGLAALSSTVLGDVSNNTMFFVNNQTSLPYKGMPSERFWQFETEDVEALRELPCIKTATGMVFGGEVNASHKEHKGTYQQVGYAPEMQQIMPQPMLYGRYINRIDMLQKRKVCVIGTQVWKDLFPRGGDPVGKTIKVGSTYLRVIGVIIKKGEINFNGSDEQKIIIPLSLTQQLYGRGKAIDVIGLTGNAHTPSKEVDHAGRQVIYARHMIAPNDEKAIWTISVGEMFDNVMKLFRGISLLTWIVGLGTLLAGVVGVSNIMLVLIKERTQEIGIRRALGAKPSVIISQILSESFVLTFIAGVLGLASAVGVLSFASSVYYQTQVATGNTPDVTFQISFGTGILSLAILIAGSLAAGVIPAYRALKIKAVDAIREE